MYFQILEIPGFSTRDKEAITRVYISCIKYYWTHLFKSKVTTQTELLKYLSDIYTFYLLQIMKFYVNKLVLKTR